MTEDDQRPAGELNCAIATPLAAEGAIDRERLAGHVGWLLARGVRRVALFGTTGEGPSFTLEERRQALEGLVDAGIAPARLIVNTGCAATPEAAALAAHAASTGCSACLVMPPFFFPSPDDAGVFGALAPVVERLAGSGTRAILYHIPSMTGVALGPELVHRVEEAFPAVVEGVKDSGAVLADTLRLIERCPRLRIFVGNEPDLPAAVGAGGAGTISGLVNCAPGLLAAMLAGDETTHEPVRRLQRAVLGRSVVPAIKALVAQVHGEPGWRRVRAPLSALDATGASALVAETAGLLEGARGALGA